MHVEGTFKLKSYSAIRNLAFFNEAVELILVRLASD